MKYLAKTSSFFSILLILLLLASCGNDDGPVTEKKEAVEPPKEVPIDEPEDETPSAEASNNIVDNVIIKGGTKIEGEPPTPNEAISLTASTGWGHALLNEGFNASISSDGEIKGAYIQFKAPGASISESYYDVDIEANKTTAKSSANKNSKERDYLQSAKRASQEIIDVGFSPEITAGEFCYLICVYDENGNISEPLEVCVTVREWGGSNEMVGKWNYLKSETYYPDGLVTESVLGEESCYDDVYTCEDGSSFDYATCFTKEEESFDFRQDGTYTHTYANSGTSLDAEALETNCSLALQDTYFNFTINGNWSYDADNRVIIVVEYDYEQDSSNGPFSYTHEVGEGDVYTLSPVKIEDGQLVWGTGAEFLGEDLNGDGLVNNDDTGWASFYEK